MYKHKIHTVRGRGTTHHVARATESQKPLAFFFFFFRKCEGQEDITKRGKVTSYANNKGAGYTTHARSLTWALSVHSSLSLQYIHVLLLSQVDKKGHFRRRFYTNLYVCVVHIIFNKLLFKPRECITYLPYKFGQTGLSKQYRPR